MVDNETTMIPVPRVRTRGGTDAMLCLTHRDKPAKISALLGNWRLFYGLLEDASSASCLTVHKLCAFSADIGLRKRLHRLSNSSHPHRSTTNIALRLRIVRVLVHSCY